MNIKNNIVNYLFDRDYIVCLYDNCVYIFNYKYLDRFDEKRIEISLVDRKIAVKGNDLLIVKMTKEELLIKGAVDGIEMKVKDEQSKN